MEKPDWDTWFLGMVVLSLTRSIDPDTKCGCVLVDKHNRFLSLGYNGPIRNSIDEEIPLCRPDKYYHMIHSEVNAILSSGACNLEGATCYTNIRPCHDCLKLLLQCGVSKFIFMDLPNAKCVDEDSIKAQEIMMKHHNVTFSTVKPEQILSFLKDTCSFFENSINN